ncbi:hypothetical protein [Photobacterium lipolyticum]|uniref:Uncharacterized protein n=1 Tax=Photobacterium lipolyticum TaxID=266810 RepID=A0A2T3N2V8_9GAMM|nr:hypothetical protein [Photobacterium lipolyticum]PSW06668.1 hypothetical protein C9I89_03800 [Photobacterium lipolyticum]
MIRDDNKQQQHFYEWKANTDHKIISLVSDSERIEGKLMENSLLASMYAPHAPTGRIHSYEIKTELECGRVINNAAFWQHFSVQNS